MAGLQPAGAICEIVLHTGRPVTFFVTSVQIGFARFDVFVTQSLPSFVPAHSRPR